MIVAPTNQTASDRAVAEPLAPEPTAEFSEVMRLLHEIPPVPRRVPTPVPRRVPLPFLWGSRFMIWKQDPSVSPRLGRQLVFVPGIVLDGPRDARMQTQLQGTTPVIRNANGDFIYARGTPQADCANAYAVARQTLTMYERQLGGAPIRWAWNSGGNTDSVIVFPRGFQGPNAYYSRSGKALKFGYFTPPNSTDAVYTCRSLDIVSHETGHAVLDGLKPGWLGWGNPPQTGGLHEAFGDLTAIFLALSQLDQVEAVVAMTRANLHDRNFLAAVAEEFGNALGRPMGLRNADNDLKLSEVSNEVHALSKVFTGAVYDILADIYTFEKIRQRRTRDPAHVLLECGHKVCSLVLRAMMAAPPSAATYAHVASKMLKISQDDGDPPIYRTFIRNRFAVREVVVPPVPLTEMAMTRGTIDIEDPDFTDGPDEIDMKPMLPDHPSLVAPQDRSNCCGTMQRPEYLRDEDALDAELAKLAEPGWSYCQEDVAIDLLNDEVAELKKAFK